MHQGFLHHREAEAAVLGGMLKPKRPSSRAPSISSAGSSSVSIDLAASTALALLLDELAHRLLQDAVVVTNAEIHLAPSPSKTS